MKIAAAELGQVGAAAGQAVKLRILDGQEEAVLAWDHVRRWYVPHWSVGYEWVP